jgi:hypothetical protein
MKRLIVLALVIAVSLSSCIFTFYPLYSDDVLVDIPGLEGSFVDRQSAPGVTTQDTSTWTFEWEGKGEYLLEITEEGETGTMQVHAVQLGGEYFLDFVVEEAHSNEIPDFVMWHLVPMHSFAKVRVHDDRLELLYINADWAQENLEKHRIRIDHETRKNNNETEFILLTASTADLQKFATKYARFDDAFEDPDVLTREMPY